MGGLWHCVTHINIIFKKKTATPKRTWYLAMFQDSLHFVAKTPKMATETKAVFLGSAPSLPDVCSRKSSNFIMLHPPMLCWWYHPCQWPFQDPIYWRYLPYIRPIFQAYVREYPSKIWPYMVQYLHFRILEFPLTCVFKRKYTPWSCLIHSDISVAYLSLFMLKKSPCS